MFKHYINKRYAVKRMQNSYFGDVFERYILHLHQCGYKPDTIRTYCQAVEHFGRWVGNKQKNTKHVNKILINNFITKHLSRCKCSPPRTKEIKIIRAAVNQLTIIIGENDRLLSSNTPKNVILKVINSFDNYLVNTCGVAENTRIYRKRYVLAFLKHVKLSKISKLKGILPKQIINFIKKVTYNYKSNSIGVVCSSLRSFLKYLLFQGYDVKKLIAAIPRLPNWKLSAIPKYLSDKQTKKFISAFNNKNSSEKRDYAMVRCLIDLGLRCSEVTKLKLQDINWHEGILKIMRGKTKQDDQLPLVKSVGEAISDYLAHGRPTTNSEFVFVFHRAPFGEAVHVETVRGVVRRAFHRAGFNPAHSTHILRHTFARNLLLSGASLKNVADMLRHRSIDATMIYTKIDLHSLRSVAMPWVGKGL